MSWSTADLHRHPYISLTSNSEQLRIDAEVELYRPALTQFALRILRNTDDAQDAVQETLLKVHRAASKYKPSHGLSPWLFRICLNCCTDCLRRRRTRRSHELISFLSEGKLEITHDEFGHDWLFDAMNVLSDREKECVILHHVEGVSIAHLASKFGVPAGTVKSWLSRSREKLRSQYS